ncbi:kWG Leptospira repeat protein [Clostridium sp. CAG:492]|nr:kWG Leptospira repeat protein [Clostridium sp. CAG:492]
MKKKVIVVLSIIILIIGIISIIKYNKNKSKFDYTIEQISEVNYFLLMQNNKYGVINKNGDIVVDPVYDVVEIPNASKPVFICKGNYDQNSGEYNIQVFNDKEEPILYQYYTVEAIKLNNVESNGNYEKSVLKYKSDNKYGLIDFSGNKITDAIYDSIEGFNYREGILLVKKSDKYGIINIKGASIIKPKYDEILCDEYYTTDSKYDKSGYIVGTKTDKGMRYGYIDGIKRKQILKNEYNDIYRITDKMDDNNIYLVAFKDGKAGVYQNKKKIINNEYEDILYDANNDLLTLQKTSKQGVSKFDGTTIIPIEYDNIFFAGEYINAQKGDKIDIYNFDGTKENSEYISRKSVADKKYEIVSTSDDKYKIINNENNKVIDDNYQYVQYLFKNYFSVTKDNKYGIIDSDGNTILDFKYNIVRLLENSNVIQVIDDKSNIELLDENLKSIIKIKDANIYTYDNYFKVYSDDSVQYFDKSGKKLESKDVFPNNKLFAYKEKNKWGFKDKDGNIVVKPIYDMVTEFNEYGYAGIKSKNKWGSINENGDVIKEPTYEVESNIIPSFIKEYYQVDLGYGEPYYTNETIMRSTENVIKDEDLKNNDNKK